MGFIKASDDQHTDAEREELLGRLCPQDSGGSGRLRLSDADVRRIAIAVRKEIESPTPDPKPAVDENNEWSSLKDYDE